MKLLPFFTGLLINSAAATAAEAQMQLRGSTGAIEAHNTERQLETSYVLKEPTFSKATGLLASTNNKYLMGNGATGFVQFFSDLRTFNEIEIQYQSDVVEPIRKVKIFDVYNNKYFCTYDAPSGHYVRLGINCDGNDEIFWEYNLGNGEFLYQSQTQHYNTDYYNDQWFREETVNGIEFLSLQGGSVATTFTKPEIPISTYKIKVANEHTQYLFIDVSCRHKDDPSKQKPGTLTVTNRYDINTFDLKDWGIGSEISTHEFVLENCEDTVDSEYQAFVKAAESLYKNKDKEYDVQVCPGMYGICGDSSGCTTDWVKLREVYGDEGLVFDRKDKSNAHYRIFFPNYNSCD